MTARRFTKVLVANRGEIAVRVIRACRELGKQAVAVFSEADRTALHVRLADEAYLVGPAPSRESYLKIDTLIDVAKRTGCEAVHPGYGFLAENAAFAQACADAGLVFIGPPPQAITAMGEKTAARRLAVEAGVPVVPGTLQPVSDPELLRSEAARIGYPLMLKAAAGGGGKGLRFVMKPEDLDAAAERAQGEARSAFGDDSIYLERAILEARHVEIQVLADAHGNAVHLFERECSVQRRHQKIVEESPSPVVSPELRARMGALAVALVKRVGYVNAGTLEFLLDETHEPYFLEMNTRIQVEHPVTEMVTGIDLVQQQILVAEGEPLPFRQEDLGQRGHAIECRVYAEDPDQKFMPSPGRIHALSVPGGPGIRDDSGVYAGFEIPVHYDSMLSKLVAWAPTREQARLRMLRALTEYRILGVKTSLPFLERVMLHPAFVAGDLDTGFVDRILAEARPQAERPWQVAVAAAAIAAARDREAARTQPTDGGGQDSGWRTQGRREALASRL